MKKIFFISLYVLISLYTNAQINIGGIPLSFNKQIAPLLKQKIDIKTMPKVDVNKLSTEDIVNDKKDQPWRFGENINVNFGLKNSGTWDILPNGDKLWRLMIYSQGAVTINLTFNQYKLPKGAKLFIYNAQKTQIIGAFTNKNNQKDGVFAATLVKGDAMIVEYFEPKKVEFEGELNINRVTHGYRWADDYVKNFSQSGGCNNNVACPESAGWENEINSVCMLVSGSNGFCTGALINNTNQDGKPYILTANHCYSSPSSWIFWFNWQSSTCANPSVSPSHNDISGAVLKAKNSSSDFCLVEMDQTPPASYGVYYAGWDNRDIADSSSVCIHHPHGDIKKITFDNDSCVSSDYDPSPYLADSHWRIVAWDDGTTEPGSSGSPLFNQNHKIIGQLHGGYASCSSNTSDYFGKFSMSWNYSSDTTAQLKYWLDPINSGDSILDGLDLNTLTAPLINFGANTINSCTGEISFLDSTLGNPYSWLWNFGDGITDTLQNPTHFYTQSGTYSVSLSATNVIGTSIDTNVNFITINLPNEPLINDTNICKNDSILLIANSSGENYWFDSIYYGNLLNIGDTFQTGLLNSQTTYYVENHVIPASVYGGKIDNSGGGLYYTNALSLGLYFDCYYDVTLKSVKTYAADSSYRFIVLKNSLGDTVFSGNYFIPQGESRIDLNWFIPAGTNYIIYGPESPNLYRNDGGLSYPYDISNLVKITGTNVSNPTSYYYYFYDWEVVGPDCISVRVPINISINDSANANFTYNLSNDSIYCYPIDSNANSYFWDFGDGNSSNLINPIHYYINTGNYQIKLIISNACGLDTVIKQVTITNLLENNENSIYIYPNPAKDNIFISSLNDKIISFEIFDIYGNKIIKREENSKNFVIDISYLNKGIYFIKLQTNNYNEVRKILLK